MEKVTNKWIKYSLKKSYKELRKKQKKRKRKKQHQRRSTVYQKPLSFAPVIKRKGRIEIAAPSNFSLINNIEGTLTFFNTIEQYIKKQKDIFFDLSNIQELTTDTILYILSYIEYNRSNYYRARISGNEPTQNDCKELLRSSGFFKHVYSQGHSILKSDPNIFSIESGIKVLSPIAAEIKKFAKERLGMPEISEAKSIYKNIIECMANTKHHAYLTGSPYCKWWVMASFDENTKKIHFTFLDNGLSIPTTLKKNFI